MSRFYGQVKGTARSMASRCGNESIKSSVQSYDGSVSMEMYYGDDGLRIRVEAAPETRFGGQEIFDGTMERFVTMCAFGMGGR